MTWNIRLFIFCMICNFFKCEFFQMFYSFVYNSCNIVLFLLSLLCNRYDLILKLQIADKMMKGGFYR